LVFSTACNLLEHSRPGTDSGGIAVHIFIFGGKGGKKTAACKNKYRRRGFRVCRAYRRLMVRYTMRKRCKEKQKRCKNMILWLAFPLRLGTVLV